MVGRDAVFELVCADGDKVMLRTLRDATAQELCAALGLSRGVAWRVLSGGQLTAEGKPLVAPSAVSSGKVIALSLRTTHAPVPASKTPAHVLWHDRFILAAEKPAGLIVHSDGNGGDTLTARVQASLRDLAAQNGWDRVPVPQALQRLDKETTGIVLFSLAEEFQPQLDALVAGHGLRKRYLAVVRGTWNRAPLAIDAPLGRDRHDARRMRVSPTGKPALTKVACLERRDGLSLMACELGTGRRHQIRVHLAHMGHPLVGDALYGGGRGALMLHAFEESFMHPVTGEPLCLRTAWPDRFSKLFSPRTPDWSILE